MIKPRYQDYQADQIPAVSADGAAVRVMAGQAYGAAGPIALRNPGLLLDVTLAPGASFTQPARAALADSAACGGMRAQPCICCVVHVARARTASQSCCGLCSGCMLCPIALLCSALGL
jgi:hypothetical protein